ncbi:FapA family protein [Spirochaeta africana]|uniref:Putative polymerase with PALM domain, HD hydrolase domain and Zn ribbon n=1 Tax=Spirochaeta africana (strain ATCC 700263 / DSM 8902 / Z-7692) TaxID=889378 RepID=H9UKT5_SPIAZ|nr:FapA family protein [Spirochaeta africana]AFG38128.1 putative polymerase with PALM domain, HD hydrolase domain and Zn ribbon [Spirochaeta africana DSM 8902]
MITYDKLQDFMRTMRDEDRERRSINVSGPTLEDALEQASIELQVPIAEIEYEVLDKGHSGVLGVGRKPVMLLAYAAQKMHQMTGSFDGDMGFDLGFEEAGSSDRDGEALVKLTPDGIMLKIKPPVGEGAAATVRKAMDAVSARTAAKVNPALVEKAVKRAEDTFIRIGDIAYNPANDAALSVELAEAEMKAYLTLFPPGPGGTDPSLKTLEQFLESNDIVFGIKDEVLKRLDEAPLYKDPILIAEGTPPVNGRDARIQYTFQTDTSHVQLKQDDKGKVDFKELNLVQNVVEGQALAKKVPPEPGVDGTTVTGKMLPATNGKDIKVEVGKNVKLSDDGNTAIALINGQVLIHNNKLTVDPVYTVDGDVSLKTGNVTFLGTVLVKGSVDDGFIVKASGNIEILGTVGKAEIDAEGDVIVHQGITGRNEGTIRCGKSVFAKFIENANVHVGEFVVVSDGIINSQVNCNRRILCKGKRAAIVGGHLRASEEIAAKTLGSVAGAETILEVGYDPRKREELEELQERQSERKRELEEASLNVARFDAAVKSKQKLTPEKQQQYKEQRRRKADLTMELQEIEQQIQGINNYLAQLKNQGRISASGTVFQGVKINIKDAVQEVRSEYKAVTFVNENGMVKITKYVEPEDVPLGR